MRKDAPPILPEHPTLPQPGLRERKRRLRLQRILSAARQLFLQTGFQNTTIADIAREAGIGLGTLYLYAPSKEDLLVAVFREPLLQLLEDAFAGTTAEAPVVDQLLAFFAVHLDWHRQEPALARAVLKELSFPATAHSQEEGQLIVQSTCARLQALLERAQSRGALSADLHPVIAAHSILALYHFHLQGWLGGFCAEEFLTPNLRAALLQLLPEAGQS